MVEGKIKDIERRIETCLRTDDNIWADFYRADCIYLLGKLQQPAPNTRQRAERAAQRIHEHLTGPNPYQVHETAIADIIAAEFEK